MPTARALLRAPLAVAYWLGATSKTGETGNDVVFRYHGTPRHLALQLRLQLRYLRRVFTFVIVSCFSTAPRPKTRMRARCVSSTTAA